MAKQPTTPLEIIASEIVRDAGLTVEYGEYEFISTATRLISPIIQSWYENAELIPPQENTIAQWFYRRKAPEWAIALLRNERQNFLSKNRQLTKC